MTTAFAKLVLPAAVVAGQPIKSQATVRLTNTSAFLPGMFDVALFLNTTPNMNGTPIALVSANKQLALRPGKGANVGLRIKLIPTSVAAGTYFLVAVLTDPLMLMNLAASATSITVAAPVATIGVAVGNVTPASVQPGKSCTLQVVITDTGNIPDSGVIQLSVTLLASNQQPLPGALLMVARNLRAKPGKSARFKLRVPIGAQILAGSYLPVVSVQGAFDATSTGAVPFSVL